MTQAELDTAFIAFAEEIGMVMDSEEDREDYAKSGHMFIDSGSDVHDFEARP